MAVKVLITRKFKTGKFNEAYKLLMELRSMATVRNGYISGETLMSRKDNNKFLVISTWVIEKRWAEWQGNQKRKDFSNKMEQFLESPEKIEVFLVGEKIPEWVDMA